MVSITHQKTPNKSYNSSHFRTPHNNNQFSRNQGKQQNNHTKIRMLLLQMQTPHQRVQKV